MEAPSSEDDEEEEELQLPTRAWSGARRTPDLPQSTSRSDAQQVSRTTAAESTANSDESEDDSDAEELDTRRTEPIGLAEGRGEVDMLMCQSMRPRAQPPFPIASP
jgi:hypothetical protein